jgi:hypothetical protein
MCQYCIIRKLTDMCYSVESSLKTSLLSLVAIIYLLSSGVPHFQWIGIALIGWCGMQFAELLLWLTDPRKHCTFWNKVITMTLIPLVLVLQPLGGLWGSTILFPWDKSSESRKYFMLIHTAIVLLGVYSQHFFNPTKYCTTVTEGGHLYWMTAKDGDKYPQNRNSLYNMFIYTGWAILIGLPLILFWNKNPLLILLIGLVPTFGFFAGLTTDSKASIWCHYTSYTSVISIICLLIHQTGIYNFLTPSTFHF